MAVVWWIWWCEVAAVGWPGAENKERRRLHGNGGLGLGLDQIRYEVRLYMGKGKEFGSPD